MWSSPCALDYDKFIHDYSEEYLKNKIIQKQKEIAKKEAVVSLEEFTLQPNSMQVDFIANLQKLREAGEKRALLISATGERDIIVTNRKNAGKSRILAAWS